MCTCAQVRGYMCAYGVVSVSDAYVWGVSVCVVRERNLLLNFILLFALTCKEKR